MSFLSSCSASATSHMMAFGMSSVSCESLKFVQGASSPANGPWSDQERPIHTDRAQDGTSFLCVPLCNNKRTLCEIHQYTFGGAFLLH